MVFPFLKHFKFFSNPEGNLILSFSVKYIVESRRNKGKKIFCYSNQPLVSLLLVLFPCLIDFELFSRSYNYFSDSISFRSYLLKKFHFFSTTCSNALTLTSASLSKIKPVQIYAFEKYCQELIWLKWKIKWI